MHSIRVQDLLVFSLVRHTCGDLSGYSGEVCYDQKQFLCLFSLTHKAYIAFIGRDLVHPLEAFGLIIAFIQCLILSVKYIQILHQFLDTGIFLLFLQLPLYLTHFVPFFLFRQILSHEEKLLAGMGHHITVSQT